ncbi:MAG TPA: hypothetical protein VHF06_02340 [Pseudonocardiaceae bacterium]|nr:hypothetical protein [Pseudonocardiaceae bacterium]
MDAVVASVIAVVGTLLGVTVTYVFQRLNAHQANLIAHQDRVWRERLAAYSEFAGAVTELLRANTSLWFVVHRPDDFSAQARRDAYTEADRLAATTTHARLRVQLVTGDPVLLARADAALEPMGAVRNATDQDELAWHERRCRQLITDFINAAGERIR